MENKDRPRNCSRVRETQETWQLNAHGILDWILDPKEDISGTVGEI